MSGRRARIWLVPTAELVCESAAALPLPGLRPDLSGSENDPDPLVYVTPERRVIAGQAYVKAWKESGRSAILCWVITDDDLGAALTRIHNHLLFRRLDTNELYRHLQCYGELCLHRHAGSPSPSEGGARDDPWSGPPNKEDAISEPDGDDFRCWTRLDRFW
jgi:hypothetical protein